MSLRIRTRFNDVFLYHAAQDSNLAIAVKRTFQAAGLSVLPLGESRAGKKPRDLIREDLTNSRCSVFLCTPASIDDQLLPFLYGAVWIHGQPTFTLRSDVTSAQLPIFLKNHPDFKLWSGIERLINSIRLEICVWTVDQSRVLIDCFREIGVPLGEYRESSDLGAELADLFNGRTGSNFDGNKLLVELQRLKVSRKLPKLAARTAG